MITGFDQWFTAAPAEAMEWLASLPAENRLAQSSLLSSIKPEAAQRFLNDHPQHPGTNLLNSKSLSK